MSDDEQRAEGGPGPARRAPVWLILGVVASALVVCCCSALIGLTVSWAAGLFGPR
ncbi:hypothetical protein ACFFMM_07945 [Micromonospora chaiyaphumensis]|uniref:Uncharacterized protein n=2 Tax=Micromonospora TaxID=1873 RepID=A0A1C4XHU0_9ACTN|nr:MULTISPECIES: hypothetical protein [Micromonospora]NES26161.1 hypothetical protein [Micromonospora terminaliae]SCF07862.1 hypothetical protein GA0070214_1065 [Micromonospora chaiyaphumensis]